MSHICSSPSCNHSSHTPSINIAKPTNAQIEQFEMDKDAMGQELKQLERVEKEEKKSFVSLHTHSYHSILDGCGSIDDYVKLAKKYGHPAMTILDHGTLSGTFEFYQKCKAAGIKPILGMEAYLNDQMGQHEEKKYEGGNSHQSLLVMNKTGFVNINKLAYKSYDEGFYRRGRISTEWLIEHKKGLFITTSCMASQMSKFVQDGKLGAAEDYLKLLMREFGDNLAAELQFNEIPGQKTYNDWLLKMISKYSLMPILTNDVHYAYPEDAKLQDTLIAINQRSQLGKAFSLDARHLYYPERDDFHKFNKKFGYNYPPKFVDMCLDNTLAVADKCSFDFEVGKENYPKYEPTPDIIEYFKTNETKKIITNLAFAKLKQKLNIYRENGIVEITKEKEQEYIDRLNYELKVIDDKSALDYFLVNWEIVNDYRKKGYVIGPARGCFISDSRIKMADGAYALINKIEVGDKLFDAFGDIRQVINRFEYDIEEDIIELEFNDGRKIECTLDHEILTNDRSWIAAKDLTEEDEIIDINKEENNEIKINLKSRKIKKYKGKVYDLEVEKTHSYNIEGLGVHNSAAGCLLSWCLDITKIDSLRFGLYFERFLNPTRKSMPDIDIDFMTGTDDVTTDFLYEKYGKERVLSVSTFSTFNEKGCLKDVVKAHHGSEMSGFNSDVFAVTKEMPDMFAKYDGNLKDWIEEWPKNPECSERVRAWLTDPNNETIFKQTLKLQGQIRGIGQHAAGVVITPDKCWNYLPTNIIPSKKSIVTAYQESDGSGKDLSALGILKLDRLKLSTLNVIEQAINIVKDTVGEDIRTKVDYVDLDDKNLFKELRLGLNHGIFQFESAGMNSLIRGMKLEKFEELVAANALYRPGPMGIGAHNEYIKNKFNPNNIKLVHPALEPILAETNGVLVFQEQLMFIANSIGGMELGEGDMLRRAMDKASKIIAKNSSGEELSEKDKNNKNWKMFQQYWGQFLKGAEEKGYKVDEIDKIKDWIIQYLGYSFNKCLSENHKVISEERGEIDLLDAKVGEKVLGHNPATGEDEYNSVKDIHHNGKKKVYRIKTTSGKVLECTLDHKIMTDSGMKTLQEIVDSKLKIKISNIKKEKKKYSIPIYEDGVKTEHTVDFEEGG